ncbi:MAG TPA: cytochrome c biogenesis protein CcsA, partial [Cellulomonas sp.]
MTPGDLSTLLVWAAATAFTVALFAYSVDLARIADAAARPRQAARAAKAAAASSVTRKATANHRVPALAGTGGGAPAALATSEEDRPPARPSSDVNHTSGADGAGAGGVAVGRSARAEGIARATHLLGLVLLLAGIVLRGIAAGRWPTANMYEFTLVGVFVATTVLAVVLRRRMIAFVGVVVTAIAVLALVLALNVFFVRADAVQPALQSYWLVIHVGVAISATGVFTVAFGTSVLQVLSAARAEGRSRLQAVPGGTGVADGRAAGPRGALSGWRVTGQRFAWLRQVPDALHLEALSFRLNAVWFVLWTFTLIAGSIWAEHAWGRYWNWDPKEVGTFVVWVVYAAYLHAR